MLLACAVAHGQHPVVHPLAAKHAAEDAWGEQSRGELGSQPPLLLLQVKAGWWTLFPWAGCSTRLNKQPTPAARQPCLSLPIHTMKSETVPDL